MSKKLPPAQVVPQIKETKEKPKATEPKQSKSNIFLYIYRGTFKENIEEGGKDMDPYCKVKVDGQEFKTEVALNQGKNPVWDFKKELLVNDLDSDMVFELWEWDKNSSDDFLASTKINLQSALAHGDQEFALEVIRKGASFGFLTIKVTEVDIVKDKNRQIYEDKRVLALQQYLNTTGISQSFQIIFAELISREIPRPHMYAYTALRLRQIGADLDVIKKRKKQHENILGKLNENSQLHK